MSIVRFTMLPMAPRTATRSGRVAVAAQAPKEFVHISSTQNLAVKHCAKLRQSKRYRQETGTALISGRDLVEELAPHAAFRAVVGLNEEHLRDIHADGHFTVTQPVMQKIAGIETVATDQLAAEVVLPEPADLVRVPVGQLSRVLVLDGVQDPGNLGTLLRTALALGWQAAVLLPGCCDPFNDKALRASRGAAFKLPLAQLDLQQWHELLQAHNLTALAAEPDRAQASSSSSNQAAQQDGSLAQLQQRLGQLRVCLCLGAEGQGLSEQVLQRCRPVSIPQGGLMESLNVSAAGAILMFALSQGSAPLLAELARL